MNSTKLFISGMLAFACSTAILAEADQHRDYPLTPMSFDQVSLQDEFWLPRLKLQAETTTPHALKQTEPAVENLRRCGNFLHGRGGELPFPHRFVSSDLYKVMEGAAYLLMIKPDPALERQLDEIINVIADAQQEDGYLYVSHICNVARPEQMGEKPYSWVVHSHELYNMGHMYEGAVAYYLATGKDKWLQIAEKSAQHIHRVFFEGDPNYNGGRPVMQAPGHEELELALCKLYRVTGNRLYLDMAKKFLDIRGVTYRPEGEGTMSPTYAQQHKPVAEQTRAVGHAVRAGYLYAAMADISALTGDLSYANAAERIWHDIVDTKMHIIGGLGACHGIEGFGPAYDLPNRETYNETCAAVANVLFNFRMYLLFKDARYFDVAEVALLNNSLAGMSLAGNSFFYVNVLETDGIRAFNHGTGGRAEWFGCACCPSNLARLIPQVSGYMYAHTDHEIYLGLYGSSRTSIPLADGEVTIEQQSRYPFDGKVKLTIQPAASRAFSLCLRIPTWARERFVPGKLYRYIDDQSPEWSLRVNGQTVETEVRKGFATINRVWHPGDTVELRLPMPVRFSTAIEQVEADRQRLAITRGPLVYCAEQADNPAAKKLSDRADVVQRFFVPHPADPSEIQSAVIKDGPLQGIVRITLPAFEIPVTDHPQQNTSPPFSSTLAMIPYYAWNNRGEDSMIVWLPRNESLARKYIASNHQSSMEWGKVIATHTHDGDTVAAVVDGQVPQRSDDQTLPRWTSLPFKNRGENIIFEFDKPRSVGSIGIYWYEEPGGEGPLVRLPRNWWVEYRLGDGEWTRMKTLSGDECGLERDRFNVVRPATPLTCDAISIRILPQVGYCMGVHEIRLASDTSDFRFTPDIGLGPESGVMRRDPSDVIKVGDRYYVWYSRGAQSHGYDATIWYATSADGLKWQEQGEALVRGPQGSWDEQSVFTPNILVAEGKYWLFYTAVPKPFINSGPNITKTAIGIAVAESPDGPWNKLPGNPVLTASEDPQQFDSMRVDDACLAVKDGKYLLYYKGRQWNNSPANTKMGVAIADHPQGPYIKYAGNPVVAGGHEVLVWPYHEGVVAMINIGPKGIARSLQYSGDGLNFRRWAALERVPSAAGAYRPEAFSDNGRGEMISWGISIGQRRGNLPYLERFDCLWRGTATQRPGTLRRD